MTASPFGALTVIANPHAGEGRVGRRALRACSAVSPSGASSTRFQVTDGPGDATRLATDASGRRRPVPGGGGRRRDGPGGRQRHVPRRTADRGRAGAGCGPGVLRMRPGEELRSPRRRRCCVRPPAGENTYPFDVMKVAFTGPDGGRTSRYSVNLAEIGFGAAVHGPERAARTGTRSVVRIVLVDPRPHASAGCQDRGGSQRLRGQGLQRDRRQRAVRLRRHAVVATLVPGRRRRGRAGVHRAHGPTRTRCCRPCTGTAITSRIRTSVRCAARIRVSIEAERPLPIVADGELLGTTPATFQIVPRSILLKL